MRCFTYAASVVMLLSACSPPSNTVDELDLGALANSDLTTQTDMVVPSPDLREESTAGDAGSSDAALDMFSDSDLAEPVDLLVEDLKQLVPDDLSSPDMVIGGIGTKLVFLTKPPNPLTAGQVMTPAIKVALQTADGVTVSASGQVALAIESPKPGAVLYGTATMSLSGGVATFDNLHVDRSGSDAYRLVATMEGVASAKSSDFYVAAAAAAKLGITQQPADTVESTSINPAVIVEVEDTFGNPVYFGEPQRTFTVTIGTNPSNAALSGYTSANAFTSANFSTLKLDKPGMGFTLVISTDGLPSVESQPFRIIQNPVMNWGDLLPVNCPTGGSALASADLNADGHADIVVACGDNTAQVFLYTVTGYVQSGSYPATSNSQAKISLVDVSGDGKHDLVFTGSNGVTVALGRGDGSFKGASSYSTKNIVDSRIADLNADGFMDLIGLSSAGVLVFLNSTTGTFPTETAVGAPGSWFDVEDVTGDGKLDIISNTNQTFPHQISVLKNSGSGTFPGPEISTLTSASMGRFVVTDADSDGKNDVVIAIDGSLLIFKGNGAGKFTDPQQTLPLRISPTSLVMLDADFDGDKDLVVASDSFFATAIYQRESSGFTLPSYFFGGGPQYSTGTAVVDIDGDMHDDLVHFVRYQSGTSALVLKTLGNNLLKGSARIVPPFHVAEDARAVAIGDLNADGNPDIAFSTRDNASTQKAHLYVALGEGNGRFSLPSEIETSNGTQIVRSMAIAQFDSDGPLDLVELQNDSNSVRFFSGKGDGTFSAGLDYATCTDPRQLIANDLNKDGYADLVVSCSIQMGILLSTGDGGFAPVKTYDKLMSESWFALVDVDNDGDVDIVNSDLFLGNGNGTFNAASASGANGFSSDGFAGLIDGDDKIDLINSSGNVYTKKSGAKFTYSANGDVGNCVRMRASDFNGDGLLDGISDAAFLMGNGHIFQAARLLLWRSYDVLEVPDVNNDGKPDLITDAFYAGITVTLNISP